MQPYLVHRPKNSFISEKMTLTADMKLKMKKVTFSVFALTKYGKFWNFLPGNFIKHTLLISYSGESSIISGE